MWERISRPWSFRQQIVVLTASVTAFAMLLLALVLQLVLAGIADRDVDRVLADRAESVIGATEPNASSTGFSVPAGAVDEGVAVYDSQGRLVAGAPAPRLRQAYERRATITRSVVDGVGDVSRVRAEPFTVGGSSGVVVVNEYLQPYEEAERLALIVSLATGAMTVAAAAGVAAWAIRKALKPVERMASTASDWSEHDLARRFSLGAPTNEITALGATLDTLLDRVSTAIRSEQRLTSELAHELRTPLTTIQGTADLMLMREGEQLTDSARHDVREISNASRRMAHTIAALLEVARTEATVLQAGHSQLNEVIADVLGELRDDSIRLEVDVEDIRLAMPHGLAVRTLSPVVHNAVCHANGVVELSGHRHSGQVEVWVRDDGPGVPPELRAVIFEPSTTTAAGGTGAGLGLALARRVARGAGGEVSLRTPDSEAPAAETGVGAGAGAGAGATFVVRLPLA
ncbi:sensor histidine kinase [Nocardioides okcheonensis]|uniref:sensor histidine kinase n=1 Tax=Nocardioides okcheonensis TaxID=2894081 RepID=UPI001E4F9748|nr:HAMP domain-containing sensor histidine kinase [Nocardioides okcheonensis]UFN45152.1 HAMP domain-containing histidine kinase [Nocardioides okcheonensis]